MENEGIRRRIKKWRIGGKKKRRSEEMVEWPNVNELMYQGPMYE